MTKIKPTQINSRVSSADIRFALKWLALGAVLAMLVVLFEDIS